MLKQAKRTRVAVAAAVLIGALFMTAPAMAASIVVIKNSCVNGAVVNVTVKNTSILPATTTVAVQAQVGGVAVWSYVPVVLLGNQQATVSAAFTMSVGKLLSVGINDDYTPF